jgi:predicted PurR-regulated permease PerM
MEEPPDQLAKLRKVALTCLYLLIIAATLWVVGQVLARLFVIVVPLAVALLLAALFAPAVAWLHSHRVPRGLATTGVLLGGLAAVGGLVYFMVSTLVDGLPGLASRLDDSYRQLRDWLTNGPIGLTGDQLDRMLGEAKNWVTRNRGELASGALGILTTAGALLAGLVVVVFVLIFFLHDGSRMWRGTTAFLPEPSRGRVREAGDRVFGVLAAYVRTTMLVALIDAVGIGLGLWLTGVPLVLPLSALVFFGAFVPIVGAFVTGIVAVLIALVSQGFVVALIVTGVVIAVQQLEGNVLEPLLMSKSVRLHPVLVLVAITVGVEIAGIVGALFAVPLAAAIHAVFQKEPSVEEPSGDGGG